MAMSKRKTAELSPTRLTYEFHMLQSDRLREICQRTGQHDPYPGSKMCRRCGWIEMR